MIAAFYLFEKVSQGVKISSSTELLWNVIFLVLAKFIMVFKFGIVAYSQIVYSNITLLSWQLCKFIYIYLLDFDLFNAFYFKIYQFLDPSLLLNIDITIKLLFFGYIKHYRERVYIFERVNFSLTGNVKGQQN